MLVNDMAAISFLPGYISGGLLLIQMTRSDRSSVEHEMIILELIYEIFGSTLYILDPFFETNDCFAI